MEMCAEDTLGQTWDCLRESNGEFLPFILMAECFLWIFAIAGGHFGIKEFKKWRKQKKMEKRMKNKWKHD
tara:strand:+ start:291 stop:500 length:210 start_codon:yes stop_codon:yes gene_type:complete